MSPDERLFKAIFENDVKNIKESLNYGADISNLSIEIFNKLANNLKQNIEMLSSVEKIIYKDIDLKPLSKNQLSELLIQAGNTHDYKLAVLSILAGADVNYMKDNLNTILHLSAHYKTTENLLILNYILSLDGVLIDKKDKGGNTPLHRAMRAGNYEAAYYLIKTGGANPFVPNNDNVKPFNDEVSLNNFISVTESRLQEIKLRQQREQEFIEIERTLQMTQKDLEVTREDRQLYKDMSEIFQTANEILREERDKAQASSSTSNFNTSSNLFSSVITASTSSPTTPTNFEFLDLTESQQRKQTDDRDLEEKSEERTNRFTMQ